MGVKSLFLDILFYLLHSMLRERVKLCKLAAYISQLELGGAVWTLDVRIDITRQDGPGASWLAW